jgi:TRAP transporter TAXI family solute receptor
MKFAFVILLGAALLANPLARPAAAQTGGNAIPTTTISHILSLGTATPGGGFPLYGNAFAEVMNAADSTLTIAPRNTKGSNENIPLLEKGELDLALVAGEPAYEAFAGIGRAPVRLKVRGARRQSLQDHSRSRRPAGCVRRKRLGPADPGALCA